jgi:hypothetical protein
MYSILTADPIEPNIRGSPHQNNASTCIELSVFGDSPHMLAKPGLPLVRWKLG